MVWSVVQLIGGLIILLIGSDLLVRSSSVFARKLGVSTIVIGLTIVSIGTSSPELMVSIQASLQQQGGIAVSNVVGSNIFNILIILGFSALVAPVLVNRQVVRYELPIMVTVSILFYLMILDAKISVWEGIALVGGLAGYIVYQFIMVKKGELSADEPVTAPGFFERRSRWQLGVFALTGLGILMIGAQGVVTGSVQLAEMLGLGQTTIGITIIAAGTSLPELATSVMAMWRGENDIAVGNVVGSNIFNILGILGAASLVSGEVLPIREVLVSFDIPAMLFCALLALPICITNVKIDLWEGVVFLLYYVTYIGIRLVIALDLQDWMWLREEFWMYLNIGLFSLVGIHLIYVLVRKKALE